jgi:hypothetical protein
MPAVSSARLSFRIPTLLATLATAIAAAPDPASIVRRSIEVENENAKRARNYTFLQRTEERDLDGKGQVKSKRSKTHDVTMLEGSAYRRLIERDDRPLPPEEEKQEQAKLQKSIEERRRETDAQRARRLAEYEKRPGRNRGMMSEIPDAFDFRLRGEEIIESRPVYVIDATPRAGYQPRNSQARMILPKLKATLWIDKADFSWVRVQAEVIDTVSVGLFLLRVSKGAQLELEQTRVNEEVWLPRRVLMSASGRVGLVKKLNVQQEMTFRNFRKFQSDSQVVSTSEVKQ